ncbi:uncharacterized protein LOC130541769 isoform X5 [Pan paniscus]|uniref:uncharacterized protein LOC130541769 isoform X5 n=1 Tax=Pan paniscus TaxID=9597 RepID=UPI0025463CDB|nr:uncharacterized protein LOC130541769 isoform X8 [Pan paniscus]
MLCFRYKEEASQSWWKARRSKSHLMWMAAGKESLCSFIYSRMSYSWYKDQRTLGTEQLAFQEWLLSSFISTVSLEVPTRYGLHCPLLWTPAITQCSSDAL